MRQIKVLRGSLGGVLRTALLASLLFALSLPSPARAAPGDLDPTFGTGGKVITDFGTPSQGLALASQPDGKIVVAGGTTSRFALARYSADGSLDATFGSGGKVVTHSFSGGSADVAHAIVILPDGKIVAAGDTNGGFALARYSADGTLDATFGAGGTVQTSFGGSGPPEAFALGLQSDGKIVAAGRASSMFALARYLPNGTLDPIFGTGGKVTTGVGFSSAAFALALQPDGKIVAAGEAFLTSLGNFVFALARYNPDGTLDATFGTGGTVTTDFGGPRGAFALALQPDGKIVVAGSSFSGSTNFVLARYLPDGSLDATFGIGGKVITDFGANESASAIALQPDGKIVLAGTSSLPGTICPSANSNFALVRYNPNGSLDGSFGSQGKADYRFQRRM